MGNGILSKPNKSAKKGKKMKGEEELEIKHNKILIIDDEPDFVEAFRRTFEEKSYQVTTTGGKDQAQEAIRSVEPDVIVLGTLAPAGQAFAMYRWLEQHPRYKDIPLLVIDARYQERAIRGWRRHEGLQMDADAYVTKPIEPATLIPQIKSLIEAATTVIKVLVVDDHTMVRAGICSVLSLQHDIEVVGEAVNGQDGFDKVLRLMPNVALVDILMPVMSGIEATRLISRECPETKVLILTQYDEEENMIVAKQSGAYGFIAKKAASAELISGIRYVAQGKYYPSSFAELVIR